MFGQILSADEHEQLQEVTAPYSRQGKPILLYWAQVLVAFMLKFWDHHGILGINARNLLYIKPYNQKSGIMFADDKLKTKQFLSARGIKVPKLLAKISTEEELANFALSRLPSSFVLKPNSGYGGEGIVVITRRDDKGWYTGSGELWTKEDISEHISDILDGRYSITNSRDTAFFEQRLVCHPDMGEIGKFGLPDIRIIVYNMVPVMAMLRIPTEESGGKANMQLGGIGAGIDLAKGEITHIAKYNRVIRSPGEWKRLKGMKIPLWDEILLMATRIQSLVTLGYLAVDIVLDEHSGPTLLEINARAGLKVQVANLAPLRDRLDKVSGVKVKTPEKGVRMAQDLFGNKIEREIEHLSGKHIIGLEEPITLNLKHGTKEILAKVNPNVGKTYLDKKLFETITLSKGSTQPPKSLTLNYSLGGVRGKTVFYPMNMSGLRHKALLGSQILKGFLVDIDYRAPKGQIPKSVPKKTDGEHENSPLSRMLKTDAVLADLDRKISLVASLRPRNLEKEKEHFFSSTTYEPRFTYSPPKNRLEDLRTQLLVLETDSTPLGTLLDMKRKELLRKLDLLDAIGDDDRFPELAVKLWGMPSPQMIQEAESHLKTITFPASAEKRSLSAEHLKESFQKTLEENRLEHWEVKIKEGIVSRCVLGKGNRILIKKGEWFSEREMKKLLVHEIETHVFCSENGKRQPYQLFHRGFANYLKTQEGLAVYNQAMAIGDTNLNATLGLLATGWAAQLGFRKLYERLRDHMGQEEAWKMAVKIKRGMSTTSIPGAFTKNALYFQGWKEVESYLKSGGPYRKLYMGKIALDQLELMEKLEGLKEPFLIRKS